MANNEYDEEKDVVKDEWRVDEHQSQPANKGFNCFNPALILSDFKDANKK